MFLDPPIRFPHREFQIKSLYADFPGCQCLRIHLPMQGTQVPRLVQEDPHDAGQPSPCTTTELVHPSACAPQQEKPPEWDAHAPQLESSPCSPQREKVCMQLERPSPPKNKIKSFWKRTLYTSSSQWLNAFWWDTKSNLQFTEAAVPRFLAVLSGAGCWVYWQHLGVVEVESPWTDLQGVYKFPGCVASITLYSLVLWHSWESLCVS